MLEQDHDKRQTTIELLLDNFASLLNKKVNYVYYIDIYFCLFMFKIFEIKRERNIATMMNFISNLQEVKMLSERNQYQTKEIAIIRIIC
jgi:hypothetical protein